MLSASLMILLAVLLGMWWHERSPRPKNELIHALRSELFFRDSRLYRTGDTMSFTGVMLERYDDGALKSRSSVSAGLLHGLSEGWYTNGQVQVREPFRNGLSHGVRTKWYPDGTKSSEATIVDGKLHGKFRRWHNNGALAEEIHFLEGRPHGVSMAYFPSGFLRTRAAAQQGEITEQEFWQDGGVPSAPSQTHAVRAVR